MKQPKPKPMAKTAPRTTAKTPAPPEKTKPSKGAKGPVAYKPTSTHMSVSVRKIDNGYIVSKYVDGPKGYHSSETYSATEPKIEMPGGAPKARK